MKIINVFFLFILLQGCSTSPAIKIGPTKYQIESKDTPFWLDYGRTAKRKALKAANRHCEKLNKGVRIENISLSTSFFMGGYIYSAVVTFLCSDTPYQRPL